MIVNKSSYAPGGANYLSLLEQFGARAAQAVYAASLTDDVTELNRALSQARTAQRQDVSYDAAADLLPKPGSDSTWGNFWDQITTDPLRAPLDGLNGVLQRTFAGIVSNPFVTLLVVGGIVAAVFYFGGLSSIKRKFTG
jgi:hypothetical protein